MNLCLHLRYIWFSSLSFLWVPHLFGYKLSEDRDKPFSTTITLRVPWNNIVIVVRERGWNLGSPQFWCDLESFLICEMEQMSLNKVTTHGVCHWHDHRHQITITSLSQLSGAQIVNLASWISEYLLNEEGTVK